MNLTGDFYLKGIDIFSYIGASATIIVSSFLLSDLFLLNGTLYLSIFPRHFAQPLLVLGELFCLSLRNASTAHRKGNSTFNIEASTFQYFARFPRVVHHTLKIVQPVSLFIIFIPLMLVLANDILHYLMCTGIPCDHSNITEVTMRLDEPSHEPMLTGYHDNMAAREANLARVGIVIYSNFENGLSNK